MTEAPRPEDELDLRERHVAVTRTARYLTAGADEADVREVWFVLHGYGQLAGRFVRPFAGLDNRDRMVVAPEALSRFYLQRDHETVGASWMTREDREREIQDYVAYLDAVYAEVMRGHYRDVDVHVVGFSQGCETAARWVAMGAPAPRRLILWGGLVPPDLNLAVYRETFCELELVLVSGRQDGFATAERMDELEARLNRHRIPFEVLSHEGGHRIDPDVLRSLVER